MSDERYDPDEWRPPYSSGRDSAEADPPEVDYVEEYDDPYVVAGRRRKKPRRAAGCLAAVVALAIIGGGFYVAVTKGAELLQSQFGSAADFPGPGSGKVAFEVKEGDTLAEMGRNLKAQGIVGSVDAFTAAAGAEPEAEGIQVGTYAMKKEMAAADALAILIDPGNIVRSTVTVPEGLRVTDILDRLAKGTDFKRAAYEKVLAKPESIGLPDYADGNAEGYLFPATYDVGPKDTPKSILKRMVDRWRRAAEDAGLEAKADALGYTPAELMIIASLIEAEGRGDDMPKIARVIYNRLETEGEPTYGLLQIDASVNYGLDQKLGVALTSDQLEQDTPYNTYTRPGLPPTPIEAPGDAAIAAAANPADGDWFFYVTVNLKTGETKFAETYDEFLTYKSEYEAYCETSEAC